MLVVEPVVAWRCILKVVEAEDWREWEREERGGPLAGLPVMEG